MKTTEQLLSQLNTMQNEHIKVLNERIKVLQQTIEINNKTIEIQRHDNNLLLQHANKKTNE
tara:strand:- start:64 stop:246 length:183 start_codon:yes stop_codon:yes gene_type:complete